MRPVFFLLLISLGLKIDDPPPSIPTPSSAGFVGLMEVKIHYDPRIEKHREKAILEDFVGRSIAYHEIRWAGDEPLPAGLPLGRLRIAGARMADDGWSVVLSTDPHPRRAVYVLDWLDGREKGPLSYLNSGVEEAWYYGAAEDPPRYSVLPRSLEIHPGSGGQHMARLGNPKKVVLRTSLLLLQGEATLVLRGNMPFSATLGNQEIEEDKPAGKSHRAEFVVKATGVPLDLEISLSTEKIGPAWQFSALWKNGDTETAIPVSQLALPFVPITPEVTKPPAPPFGLEGGDSKKGAEVFASEAAKCFSCHEIAGKGGSVGPNLDGLGKRDVAEIYQSIAEPSARIVPEYLTYTVARKDGQIAVGVVRAEGVDAVRVFDINGKATVIPKVEIEEMRPSATSTMPVGLAGALGEEKMRDLIAYLRAARPKTPEASKP